MAKDPKVSVIIPIYNVESYVYMSLLSVKKQTFTDWECICIDDGSTDNSARIAADFAAHDKRFKLIRQENAGVSAARNAGLDIARGEYFSFLDSDDIYNPSFLEIAVKMADMHKCDLAMQDTCRVPENFELGYQNKLEPIDKDPAVIVRRDKAVLFYWTPDFELGGLWCHVWRSLYKRDVLGHVRFNTDMTAGEDDLYMLEILEFLTSYVKIDAFGVYYRMSRNSVVLKLMDPKNAIKNQENHIQAVNISCGRLREMNPNTEYAKMLTGVVRRTVVAAIITVLRSRSQPMYENILTGISAADLAMLTKGSPRQDKVLMGLFFSGFFRAAIKYAVRKKLI